MRSPRIAYVINHVAFFVSHRLPLAIGARQAGFEVKLFTGQAGSPSMESLAEAQLTRAAIPHERVGFRSAGVNPFIELWGLVRLIVLLRRYRPDIVHCASPKGVLYGGLAARICGATGLVLAVSGMGYAFTSSESAGWLRRLARFVSASMAQISFRHPNVKVIVQNKDDYSALIGMGLVTPDRLKLIPGSGVELDQYSGCSPQGKELIVLLPARMVRDKGVEEFVAAARQIKSCVPEWRFVLAGIADYENPSAITAGELDNWQRDGIVEWIGHVGNMISLFSKSSIVCLPSYREGMPKVLLEAAAAGCATVTTDVVGCREAIIPGVTGELVPPRDSDSLAHAILGLIQDPQRRAAYGYAGQELAIREFSVDRVVEETNSIYRCLI